MGDIYDITVDHDSLTDYNGTLMLGFSPRTTIADLASNRLNVIPIGIYESSFVIDNAAPRVSFSSPGVGRIKDARANLTLTFNEAVYGDASGTAFTESTLDDLIDLRRDDESGADMPFTASIER